MMSESIRAAISGLTTALEADGAHLKVQEVRDERVRLSLQFGRSARCEECILPKQRLVELIEIELKKHGLEGKAVELSDPRDEAP